MAVACLENHVFTPPRFLQFIPAVTGLLYVIARALLPERHQTRPKTTESNYDELMN